MMKLDVDGVLGPSCYTGNRQEAAGLERVILRAGVLPFVAALLGIVILANVDMARAQADPCTLLSQAEIEAAVDNPVLPGEPYGAGACRWDTEQREQVTVLLIAHPTGSIREPFLCSDLREGSGIGEPLSGVEDVALWRFGSVLALFNSGELETCGPRGYISLQLNGERDEAALKRAALTLLGIVAARL